MISHSSCSDTLKHRWQNTTRAFASVMARAKRWASSVGSLSRWKAMRCADFGPIPGSRPSSSINACTGAA
jgi:hypothetical protein